MTPDLNRPCQRTPECRRILANAARIEAAVAEGESGDTLRTRVTVAFLMADMAARYDPVAGFSAGQLFDHPGRIGLLVVDQFLPRVEYQGVGYYGPFFGQDGHCAAYLPDGWGSRDPLAFMLVCLTADSIARSRLAGQKSGDSR